MRFKVIFILLFFSFISNAKDSPLKCGSESHGAFDFWLGEWRVSANGKLAGINHIEKIQNGCVIRENWESATSDYTGTSYNFYDSETGRWQQLWLDNKGDVLQLSGNLVQGKMVLESPLESDGSIDKAFNRVTWSQNEDGSIRQLWELVHKDKTDQVIFDGLYRRIDKTPLTE